MSLLLLRPHELQGLMTMKDAIDAVEQGYREAHDYPVINAPRRRVHAPSGVRVSSFPGGVHGLGVIGSLTRAEVVRQADTHQTYSYREHPVYVLHDSNTGHLLAILIGEIDEKTLGRTSLMAFRTAATSGVGFRYLPRREPATVGLLGSGGQAANQLLAFACERRVERVRVYSRNAENRRAFAEKYGPAFGLDITPVDSVEAAILGADAILCATNTNVPLFDGHLLEPGQHVTGIIGSNIQLVQAGFLRRRRRELDDTTATRADVIVTNWRDSIVQEQQGDLYEPIEKGLIKLDDIYELGELSDGTCPGRTRDDQITYHKNGSGTGVSDLAIAMRAYELARADGRGMEIDLG